MTRFYDRVVESSTTPGTGPITMLGPVAGFQSFASVFAISAYNLPYLITDGTNWEVGLGTLASAEVLDRTTVYSSSNSNALVNFTSAVKTVSIQIQAFLLNQLDAIANGNGVIGTSDTDTILFNSRIINANSVIVASAISSGTLGLDLNTGRYYQVSLNQSITTFTVANPSASGQSSLVIKFTANGTAYTVTWPTGTVWPGGTAPTMTSTNGKRDLIGLMTDNAGTTWFGSVIGQNY